MGMRGQFERMTGKYTCIPNNIYSVWQNQKQIFFKWGNK